MIIVVTDSGEHAFDTATRFSTDEDNNLCIWTGREGDKLMHLFATDKWLEAGVMLDGENAS